MDSEKQQQEATGTVASVESNCVCGHPHINPDGSGSCSAFLCNCRTFRSETETLSIARRRIHELENVLAEIRSGYDEYYESGNSTRLLNGESRLRGLYPPPPFHAFDTADPSGSAPTSSDRRAAGGGAHE